MAVRFDADGEDYLWTGATAVNPPCTILCWGMVSTDRNAFSSFLEIHSGTNANNILLDTGTDGTTLNGFSNPNGRVATGVNMSVGTWYKMAIVVSGGTGTLYYAAAGSALSSAAFSGGITATGLTGGRIGEAVSGGEWVNGRVANVKVYSAALSSDELEAEFAQFQPTRTSNLARWHPLHVPDLADYSGNGNTLSVTASGAHTEADPPAAGAITLPAWVADRGTTTNVTAGSTQSHTITSPTSIAVGNFLIARVALDNTGGGGAATTLSISDPRSNTWTVLGPGNADPGAASAGSTAYLCYARVVTAYQAADALTLNFGNSTAAKAVVVEEWSGIHPTAPVAVTAVTNNSVSAGSTTAVTATIVPTDAYQLVYTCLATEGIAGDSVTYDTDTTNGLWSTLTRVASADATATNNQCVAGQYKAVTASGSQTWNATITSRDWGAVAVVFAATPYPSKLTVANQAALVRANSW